ncbi:MAG: arginine--tRNA ligase [Clostridiales bacterium]|nr:arginine--tRNA ligase [Clostridiales bacterium]
MFNPIDTAKKEIKALILSALGELIAQDKLPPEPIPAFNIEIPNDRSHGDFSSNIALVSAKAFRTNPRQIASLLQLELEKITDFFNKCEIAGPGFINFFLGNSWYSETINEIIAQKQDYGKTDTGNGKKVLVEFVSANPTGPMHIGNARGGALGDCLSSVLECAGYEVCREFYVNDAGNQIEKFALSLDIRYRQHFGEEIEMPEDSYHGEDIINHVKSFAEKYGDKYINSSEEVRKKALVDYALPININTLETDLLKYRVKYDSWFRESTLHQNGAVDKVIEILRKNGHTYESEGALWLKATDFGADKDFVLVRSNGFPTYIVPDIAYHYDKLVTRGYDKAIDVLGADHHGYVQRMRICLKAMGIDEKRLDVVIMQMVRLIRVNENGEKETVKLSKRSGKAITLSTLLDEVPIDAARFFFNLRDSNTHLEFDLDLAIEESSQNPVFYVQYAHARICRVLEKLKAENYSLDDYEDELKFITDTEISLVNKLVQLPNEVNLAANEYNPSRITRYCYETAQLFHKFYDECKIIGEEKAIMYSRMALCIATKTVLSNMLNLLKVDAPEKM